MDEAGARIALSEAGGVPAGDTTRLLEAFGGAAPALEAGPRAWARLGLEGDVTDALQAAAARDVGPQKEWLGQPGRGLLALTDGDYPELLRRIPGPPPLLYYRGDPALLRDPQLAVVGARHATAGGLETTRAFARGLAQAGLGVTSGLALGVDGAAHAGALDAGGATVAVCATGLDRVYPAAHRGLAGRVAEGGVLVSEFPLGSAPRRQHFPRRNRIISGLALGVLVVEAARGSGSLITARLAGEQGREVMAIPGSIHNPMSRGCHALIRDGAKLVETLADILEELPPLAAAALAAPGPAPAPVAAVDPAHQEVLEAMGFDPVSVDQLVARTGLTPEGLSSILLMLELAGQVAPSGDGRYSRLGERS